MRQIIPSRLPSLALCALLGLGACAEREIPLPGERIDPRDALAAGSASPLALAPVVAQAASPLALPPARGNAEWTHRAGGPAHDLVNPAIGAGTGHLWAARIGAASGRQHRITADPVVSGGRVFAMDSRARVTAVSTAGGALWSADLTPQGDAPDDASGGGLAVEGGTLYVTTGFGELVALEAASGKVRWRQSLPAAVGGAPTVRDGIVYVVARDSSAWAIRAADGKVQWQFGAPQRHTGVTGVSAPAVDGRIAVFPFPTGDLRAVLKEGGLDLWSARVGGDRLGRAYAAIRDFTGDPVITGGRVYAGTSSGRLGAFDAGTGAQVWLAQEGAMSPVQVAGGAVFLVSDENRLVRLDAQTGLAVWAVDLPFYEPVSKDKKRRDIRVHYGPLLAGGRLFVGSSDGLVRVFDPASGAMTASAALPGGAATAPVVAGGVLYIMSTDGQLHAYR